MSDKPTLDKRNEDTIKSDSQIENSDSNAATLSDISEPQGNEPNGLTVFFVTSSQTRLPSRYRRRRRRAGTRLAHMARRELRYTGPNFGDIGR